MSRGGEDYTVDAFHRGAFHLVQPAGRSHRAGMDAMILASAVPDGFAGRLADIGAGAGGAALAVLSRCAGARAVLVEKSPEMAGFARQTLTLLENERFQNRTSVVEADASLSGRDREAAGLKDRSFDFVIMNPPFNDAGDRRTPHELKARAHVMEPALFENWLRTAAAVLRPTGSIALIARPGSLRDILDALGSRFGDARVVPVHPRNGEPAIRIVVSARRGSRAGLSLLPPLVLHGDGQRGFLPRADALINGRSCLFAGTDQG